MNWLTGLAAKILIASLAASAIFAAGFIGGRQSGKMEQLADTVEAYQKSGKIHADVGARDDRRICLDLGGLPNDCDQLRRLGETPAGE